MSTTLSLLEVAVSTAPDVTVVAAEGDDVFSTGKDFLADVKSLIVVAVPVVGMGYLIFKAWVARMALAAVVMAAFTVGLFGVMVLNTDKLQTLVENTFNLSAPAQVHQPLTPAAPQPDPA